MKKMATHPLSRHSGHARHGRQAFPLSFEKRGGPRGRVGRGARHRAQARLGAQAVMTMKIIVVITPYKTMPVFTIINYFGQQ